MELFGFSVSLTSVIICLLLVILAYMYSRWDYGFWKARGIPGPMPLPFIGTSYSMFTKGMIEHDKENIQKYGKVYGEFFLDSPMLVIGDPAMLREILVKEFQNFPDHIKIGTTMMQYQYGVRKFLTSLRGEEWKRVRNTLTPAFSASKMKLMTKQINQCLDIMFLNLKKLQDQDIEIKKSADCFTFDVIARVGFGVELDSQEDPDNPFVKNGRRIFQQGFSLRLIVIFLLTLVPPLYKMLASLFPRQLAPIDLDITDFFLKLIRRIIKDRNEGNKQHHLDLIQLMLNAHQLDQNPDEIDYEIGEDANNKPLSPQKGLTEEEILGQSFLIFLAGFETTSTTISFLLYNFALNPECQEKARQEVDDVMKDETEVTYDMSQKFHYLEMCIQETLRIFSPAARSDRHCINEITIKGVTFPANTSVGIPIYSIHHDPDIWPDPEKFKPERFTTEEKASRDSFCYLPFGLGPRSCVGMRLAQMEGRIAAARILRSFIVKTCDKTQIPLQLSRNTEITTAKGGIYLKVEPR